MEAFLAIISIISYVKITDSVPPAQCFANFRWDDCGQAPKPVMYYWKPGSRCEVGIWRGCLPNINMFKDEYECVSTCIFAVRAQAKDWHLLNLEDETTTELMTTTEADVANNATGEAGIDTAVTGEVITTDVGGDTAEAGDSSEGAADSTGAGSDNDTVVTTDAGGEAGAEGTTAES